MDQKTKTDDILYVGTYSVRGSEGIYGYRFDPDSGSLAAIGLMARAFNPSFLVLRADQQSLYAVSETDTFDNQASGSIGAYRVDQASGALTLINEIASLGGGPCYLSLSKNGEYVMVASFQGGSTAVFPIMPDGGLGKATAFVQNKGSSVTPERQEGPHAHAFAVSPDDRYVVAADLGIDRLMVWPFDSATGRIENAAGHGVVIAPGSGPRHFCFHPNGRFLYLVNEISSTVMVFSYQLASGALRILQTISSRPHDFSGHNDAAEIAMDLAGRYLYVSNRGADSIHVFGIDAETGTIKSVGSTPSGGKTPVQFAIDPDGRFLVVANTNSDNITTFRVDSQTGGLTRLPGTVNVPCPTCLIFLRPR